uniref:Uncharacterized protein n=1 Tax=Rhizophora mucronata TaxID=61149 RepID=A0A2P2R0E9_RHIMU
MKNPSKTTYLVSMGSWGWINTKS